MKKLELSDKVASVEMTVTQVGVALAAVHTALDETERWVEETQKGTDEQKEAEWFSKQLNDIAYNLATVLQKAAEEDKDETTQ